MAAGRGCNQRNEGQERAALLCGRRPRARLQEAVSCSSASDLGIEATAEDGRGDRGGTGASRCMLNKRRGKALRLVTHGELAGRG